MKMLRLSILVCLSVSFYVVARGCQFYPIGEYLRFVRVPENLAVGGEVLKIQVHPRKNLTIQPIDKKEDVQYFSFVDVNITTVSLLLARSLEDLVDRDNPQNVLKFRLVCDGDNEDSVSSYLSVTVYVEDVNDHAPVFVDAPYHVTVDELTPPGLIIYRGIQAFDRDKPNTPNSDVQYSIAAGDGRGRFALESSHRALLVVKKSLDYDNGDRDFVLTITATDRGSPPRSTNTTIHISVLDNDDLHPKFTQEVYKTQVTEFYPITGTKIHQELKFKPRLFAYDQDIALDSQVRYDIVAGNERQLFALDAMNGTLFLEKEIDLDAEKRLPGNTFILQVQATQMDNPLKTAVARVEIEVLDINDNLPEFEVDFYNISIVENLPNGFSVLQVMATDRDQGVNGEFAFILDDHSGAFNLDSRTGWLTVRDQVVLDREKQPTLSMKVYAKEKAASVVNHNGASSSVTVDVTLLDANDNNPSFMPTNLYEFMVRADAKIGDTVGVVKAVDPDLGWNGMVLYDIQRTTNGSASTPFGVDAETGQVMVIETPLMVGRHALFIEASDQPVNPSERRYSLAVVTVDVLKIGAQDGKEELPDFVGAPYEFWVGGNVGIGTSVGQIRVNDVVKKHNVVYDLLHSYQDGVPFAVEERSGTITVISDLDKFERPIYDFEAVVSNGKDLSLITNVTVHVVDPDDERGILMKGTSGAPIEFRVRENMSGALIGRLFYQNTTKNITSKSLRFVIANQPDVTDNIAISQDGTLYTRKGLDREERDVYRLTVIAEYNKGFLSGAGIYQVTVFVDDDNDNAPIFTQSLYEGKIKENSPPNTEVEFPYVINATDKDKGLNAQFTLTLFGDGQDIFHVNQSTGKVIYKGNGDDVLDREVKSVYHFRLVARDKGSLSSEVRLTILIEDENDNPPMFLQMVILPEKGVEVIEYDETFANFTEPDQNSSGVLTMMQNFLSKKASSQIYLAPLIALPENIPVGTSIVRMLADDRDFGANAVIKYSLLSETSVPALIPPSRGQPRNFFVVQPATGEIVIVRSLPAEVDYRLNISASDTGGLKDNVTVRIHVKDVNDHAPVFKKSWYSFDAAEALYSRTNLGRIEAVDSDYGQNANISYFIMENYLDIPFMISELSGVLSVNGELDRETRDEYRFKVIARDNAPISVRMSSTVDVEVNVLDVNDNAPMFYGYDRLVQSPHPEASDIPNHNFESVMLTPIYFAKVPENSPIGTAVTRVFANDSDFSGNGNGLLLFDIPQRKNQENLFAVDSKDGIVTTVGKLDYEVQSTYNVTIVASDLGSPSLSSTALLIVSVGDIPEEGMGVDRPVFSHRYYEVEIEENVPVPLLLLTLNVTESYKTLRLKFSIIPSADSPNFRIDPRNGTLFMVISPDREKKAYFEVVIRVDKVKLSRGMLEMVYPIGPERLTGLKINEVKIITRIIDVNDNFPKFTTNGRPIVAAIPTSAGFGYQILRLQATDEDEGTNGEVRYQILGRPDEETRRFTIDPLTGQVRSVASFSRDAGRVFGFDVKATDRRGADDGKSAIANVFVYVLDEDKQLVMVMGSQPTDVERSMDNITTALYNVTGYDVRVRKLEPHTEKNLIDNTATDMYLYAVDPLLNVVIDMNQLEKVLHKKQTDIERQLEPYHILDIATGINETGQSRSQRFLLSTLEIGVVVLGCVIFIVALASAICISCSRKRRRNAPFFGKHHARPVGYAIAADTLVNPSSTTSLFPTVYREGLQSYSDPVDPYLPLPKHTTTSSHGRGLKESHVRQPPHLHNVNCVRYNKSARRERHGAIAAPGLRAIGRPLHALETSIASLHSSGKDSGIVDSAQDHHLHHNHARCQCGHSTTQSSAESTNSYEDSLKSTHPRSSRHTRNYSSSRRPQISHSQLRQMRHSFHEDIAQSNSMMRRLPSIRHHQQHMAANSAVVLASSPSSGPIARRHSDRLILACPVAPP